MSKALIIILLQHDMYDIIPGYILHELEVGARGVDLAHGPWGKFVHEVAQDDPILESVSIGLALGKGLAKDRLDPLLDLGLLRVVPLAEHLEYNWIRIIWINPYVGPEVQKIFNPYWTRHFATLEADCQTR